MLLNTDAGKWGALIRGGFQGYGQAQALDLQKQQADREQALNDLRIKLAKIGVANAEKDQGVLDKERQVRSLKADYDLSEENFRKTMQDFEHKTRKTLAITGQKKAGIEAKAVDAQAANQPDQLAIDRADLTQKVTDAIKRQTATVYGMFKLGNTGLALKMLNQSKLVAPGQRYKGVHEETSMVTGPDGKPRAVKTLVFEPEGKGGTPMRWNEDAMQALQNQVGSVYKSAGSDLLRIGPYGSVTPVYQPDKFSSTSDGDIYSTRTGQAPAAAAGVNGAPGVARGGVGGTDKRTTRLDARVKQGTAVVNRYFGIDSMTGLDPKNQPAYIAIVQSMGQKVRAGVDPETAAQQAIDEYKRAQVLKSGATAPGGNASGYTGPRPWASPSLQVQ